jgi:hypothetical protein
MNNKHIPESEINARVAKAQKIYEVDGDTVWIEDTAFPLSALNPLTNHNLFHELWTPDMEAKASDVLDGWFTVLHARPRRQTEQPSMWWHNPEYQANRRLWQLRAYCEVMGGKE